MKEYTYRAWTQAEGTTEYLVKLTKEEHNAVQKFINQMTPENVTYDEDYSGYVRINENPEEEE